MKNHLPDRCHSNELYDALPPSVRDRLAACAGETRTFLAGTQLIRAGVQPECLVIIELGRVEISLPTAKSAFSLVIAGKGKVFGLRSLVSGDPPEIDVTTLEKCTVTMVPQKEFTDVLNQYPQMYAAIAKVLSTDLKTAQILLRQVADGIPVKRLSAKVM